MLKRTFSWVICLTLVVSMFSCWGSFSSSAATLTQNQTNMVLRADAVYGCVWTAKATVKGWRGNYTYSKGSEYRLPYGQPATTGKYIGFNISIPDFLKATTDANNEFYTKKSEYAGATSTYYATDCSAFVSYCWGISRNTTASLPNVATSYGLANSSNVDKIIVGDALNYSGSHVVLVTDVTYSGSQVSKVEITEQTPPQIKRTTYTRSEIISKYGNSYKILRYTKAVAAPTYTLSFDANGGTGTMSDQKVNYGVSTAIKENKFTRAGYKFVGWNAYRPDTKLWCYSKSDGTKGWYTKGSQPSGYSLHVYKGNVSKAGYGVGDTLEMKAVWEAAPTTFTFTFDANGGTGTMKDQEIEYGVSTNIRANKFTNEGYDFYGWVAHRTADNTWRYTNGTDTGWYKKSSRPKGYYYALYKDGASVSKTGLGTGDVVEMQAAWGSASYKVKYDANGGSGTMSNSSHVYGIQSVLRENTFTKSKSTFTGWNMTRKSDGKTRYILGETTKWCLPGEQPDGYTVELFEDQQTISKLSTTEGDVVTATAYWTPKATGTQTFYIDYNGNGGTGTMARTTVVYGTTTTTSKNTFVKSGYKFAGWRAYRISDNKWRCVGPDGTTKWYTYEEKPANYTFFVYKDGVNVSTTTSTDCDIVTFYATWEKDNTVPSETVSPTTAPTEAPTSPPTETPTSPPTEPLPTEPPSPQPFVLGDVNGDTEITIADVTYIQRYLAYLISFNEAQNKAADVDGDTDITIGDATLIQRYIARIIDVFPASNKTDKI